MSADLINTWRQIIIGAGKSWVLFRNGTCVILMDPADDLAAQAVAILREYGPVHAGSSAGDFTTVSLDSYPGWVVAGHHPDVLTYVGVTEISEPSDLVVGLHGRSKRDLDARDLEVIHVEDRRGAAPP